MVSSHTIRLKDSLQFCDIFGGPSSKLRYIAQKLNVTLDGKIRVDFYFGPPVKVLLSLRINRSFRTLLAQNSNFRYNVRCSCSPKITPFVLTEGPWGNLATRNFSRKPGKLLFRIFPIASIVSPNFSYSTFNYFSHEVKCVNEPLQSIPPEKLWKGY